MGKPQFSAALERLSEINDLFIRQRGSEYPDIVQVTLEGSVQDKGIADGQSLRIRDTARNVYPVAAGVVWINGLLQHAIGIQAQLFVLRVANGHDVNPFAGNVWSQGDFKT